MSKYLTKTVFYTLLGALALSSCFIHPSHSQVNNPFKPTIKAGAPGGGAPKSQLYFDNTATPYQGYVYDFIAGAWKLYGSTTSGFVTGSGVANSLVKWSSSTNITNGDLAGDCTTGGTLTVNCAGIAHTWNALQKFQQNFFCILGTGAGCVVINPNYIGPTNITLTIPSTTGDTFGMLGTAGSWTQPQTYGPDDIILTGAVNGDLASFDGSHALQDSGTLLSSLAPLASPTFTGTPAAPTAAVNTNTTQIATTAYVIGQGYGNTNFGTSSGNVVNDIVTMANTTVGVKDSGTLLSSLAPLASPALTGTPTAPTAAAHTNTTQLATTAYVDRTPGTYQGTSLSMTPSSSTTEQMAGFAGTITPAVSGTVVICITGYFTNAGVGTADEGIEWRPSYGTGTAPTANAALTGTQLGTLQPSTLATTATGAADIHQTMAGICAVATGLTIGTAYWLDASQEGIVNTSNVLHGQISAYELL